MSPKEKALALFKAYQNIGMGEGWAKDCMLITVNEVLGHTGVDTDGHEYWQEVKLEIKKL